MKNITTLLFLFFVSSLFGQVDTIYFANPSFEEPNKPIRFIDGELINHVFNCGFKRTASPIIHRRSPDYALQPYDGDAYLGLITFQDNKWQSVSQRVSKILKKGHCYAFTLGLATIPKFYTSSLADSKNRRKTGPILLRIYAGKNQCDMNQLIGYTQLIGNKDWMDYSFSFEAKEDIRTITFEVYYQTATINHYRGTIFLDHFSPIIQIPCEEANVLDPTLEEKYIQTKKLRELELEEQQSLMDSRKSALVDILEEKVKKLFKVGLFAKKEKETTQEGRFILNEIITLLKKNPSIGIDIGVKKAKGLTKWRRAYLAETFYFNELESGQYDVDKISNFLDINWTFENDFMAISIYKN